MGQGLRGREGMGMGVGVGRGRKGIVRGVGLVGLLHYARYVLQGGLELEYVAHEVGAVCCCLA